MKEIVTDRYIMKVVDFQRCVEISCPETCDYSKEKSPHSCFSYEKDTWSAIDNNKIKISIIKLIIKNISPKLIDFDKSRFDVVDNLGFIYSPLHLCETILIDKRAKTNYYELPPNTQMYFNLYTIAFEEGTHLSKVHYTVGNNCQTIFVSEVADDIITTEEKLGIENYKLSEEYLKIQEQEKVNDEDNEESALHYRTEEDDECIFIISDEKEKLITFSRKFDLNKSNYNWVNKGEPLITLYFDQDNSFKFAECELNSPTTGVFEFDKKRFIAYGELICRIRKFSLSEKAEVFRELEKIAIKEALVKKEQKKKLEREALDELIADGLIFNTYIDKMGNRNKISNEVANAVWNRDGGCCCFCGSRESLEFDHIIPVSKGGATTFQNLQLLCKPCNIRKYNKIG